jgi:uncharacterized YigZ family protein
MASAQRYPVPRSTHRVTAEIQRSRFITTLAPAATVEDAADVVRQVSAEFADATHNCWAYVVGPPGSTARIGMSDAGEPHGTAGRPMLTALLHGGVGDVVAVVTRYYGGTKLGTGGLVRAYGGGVRDALATLPLAERVETAELDVRVDYAHVAAVQHLLPAVEAEVLEERYLERVSYRLRLPAGAVAEFQARLTDATRGQAVVIESSSE